MVSNELPQDTGASFQEFQSAAQILLDNALLLGNLELLAFLTLVDKVAHIDNATILKSRPEDISFLRFNCVVDGATIDSRITAVNPLLFQFYLKLPQYIYNVSADTATPVLKASNTPAPSSIAKSLTNFFRQQVPHLLHLIRINMCLLLCRSISLHRKKPLVDGIQCEICHSNSEQMECNCGLKNRRSCLIEERLFQS